MEKRYELVEAFICTFNIVGEKTIQPNFEEYPIRRLCVIDNENNIVVDVIHGLKYDYINCVNQKYIEPGSIKKIEGNKRAAILATNVNLYSLNQNMIDKVNEIKRRLDNGTKILDGNGILNNDEYKELIEKEKLENQKKSNSEVHKILKIFRKK